MDDPGEEVKIRKRMKSSQKGAEERGREGAEEKRQSRQRYTCNNRSLSPLLPSPLLLCFLIKDQVFMSQSYDAIIIGAGHNGLVTAAYLAKKGYKPLVLERREVIGGCCVTEEVWPGYKVSTAAYVNSLLRPEIIRDLELKKYGFEMLPRSPSSFSPFPDGRYLMMGPDKELTHREVSKFSAKDAEALPSYEAMLTRVADFLEPMLAQTPPDPWSGPTRRYVEPRQTRLEVSKDLGKTAPKRSRSSPVLQPPFSIAGSSPNS